MSATLGMSPTLLSVLADETVLHNSAMATVTNNWIVVRQRGLSSHSLVAISSLSCIKLFKTTHLRELSFGMGCLLVALATLWSKEADGTTLPFALVGLGLLAEAQMTRQASVGFVSRGEQVRTAFGSLNQTAALVAAVRAAQGNRECGSVVSYRRSLWLKAYLALLV
jgi:hypothetical protein